MKKKSRKIKKKNLILKRKLKKNNHDDEEEWGGGKEGHERGEREVSYSSNDERYSGEWGDEVEGERVGEEHDSQNTIENQFGLFTPHGQMIKTNPQKENSDTNVKKGMFMSPQKENSDTNVKKGMFMSPQKENSDTNVKKVMFMSPQEVKINHEFNYTPPYKRLSKTNLNKNIILFNTEPVTPGAPLKNKKSFSSERHGNDPIKKLFS